RGNRMKVLVHDGLGIWLCARRLNQGKFHWAGNRHGDCVELCPRCLSSLLEPVIRRLLIADPVEPAGLPGRGSARLSGAVSSCGW
ncbi:IS66 family insertion sequence element accessory protein TnpB, partial [Cobetia sp. MC34]|nr:IS66 family insertion sequence element accessory protein TnpB [Cobetia sp. MC34]